MNDSPIGEKKGIRMKKILLTRGKVCGDCKQIKAFPEFNKSSAIRDGMQRTCRECQRKYRETKKEHLRERQRQYQKTHPEVARRAQRRYRERHRDKVLASARNHARRIRKEQPHEQHLKDRNSALRRNYKIDTKTYNNMAAKQGGKCLICGQKENRYKYLCVDHNHKTGKIRGLLCNKCNAAIGLVNENTDTLIKMIEYLKAYDLAVLKHHGEFALTNKMLGLI